MFVTPHKRPPRMIVLCTQYFVCLRLNVTELYMTFRVTSDKGQGYQEFLIIQNILECLKILKTFSYWPSAN